MGELWKRLCHRYYILHGLYGFVYLTIQFYKILILASGRTDNNVNALLLLGGLSLWKCVMASTAEELTSVIILYTKVYTLGSLYWKFGVWRMALYVLGWITLSTLFPQPWYQGQTRILELTEDAFRKRVLILQKKTEKDAPVVTEIEEDAPTYWVVMLYANWSIACLNFEGVLAQLSVKYDVPHIKFAKVDIDLYPDLAQEFGISRDPASFDLPTLVLFRAGKEIHRLPELSAKDATTSTADAAKDTITRLGWSKKAATVIRSFQLEKIVSEKMQ